jgi:hypothetical protein
MIALLIASLLLPVIFPLAEWIVDKSFNVAGRVSRFRGRICL